MHSQGPFDKHQSILLTKQLLLQHDYINKYQSVTYLLLCHSYTLKKIKDVCLTLRNGSAEM